MELTTQDVRTEEITFYILSKSKQNLQIQNSAFTGVRRFLCRNLNLRPINDKNIKLSESGQTSLHIFNISSFISLLCCIIWQASLTTLFIMPCSRFFNTKNVGGEELFIYK